MKFRLTISKSIVIDTEEVDRPFAALDGVHYNVGKAWKEQILEALRDDNPEAQIDTSSSDEQIGAIVRCIEYDVAVTVDDFEIIPSDIQVEILSEEKAPEEKTDAP